MKNRDEHDSTYVSQINLESDYREKLKEENILKLKTFYLVYRTQHQNGHSAWPHAEQMPVGENSKNILLRLG